MKIKLLFIFCILSCTGIDLNAQVHDSIGKHWSSPGKYDTVIFVSLSVNSNQDDYAPMVFTDNRLYFTSDRRNRDGDKADLAYNEKIYEAKRVDTVWSNPKASYYFNTDDQTALAGVSVSEGKLFIYKTFGNGDFYFSKKKKDRWTSPKKVKSPINSDGHEQSIAEENGILVISSDRLSEDGTHDIIWAMQNKNGNYVDFFSLNVANTDGDEVDVRLDKTGKKLFYASNGPGGKGNFDIYCTTLNESGKWQQPVALPYPINTDSNDRYFFDCDSAFFLTSDRQGGKGKEDIYWGYVKRVIPEIIPVIDTVVPEIVKDTDRFVIMNQMLDSAGVKKYYARVQIGAYYGWSVERFKRSYPGLKDRDIYIEQVVWKNGRLINKFILNKVFSTIKEASVVQREMWTTHKITDAFVAIYDAGTNERVAIYNTIIGEFVILKGDQKPKYF